MTTVRVSMMSSVEDVLYAIMEKESLEPTDKWLLTMMGVGEAIQTTQALYGEFFRKMMDWEREKMTKYNRRFDSLERELGSLSAVVSEIKDALESPVKTIVVRQVTRKEAKKEIRGLLKKARKKIYPSEVAAELGIDLDLTFEIIEELLKEGKIEVVEEG